MAVIGEMDVFTVNKDKQYEVVDRKSRQSIEKINKGVNNLNKDVTAGKVWKSTNDGAGWADSDSMSDNQSGGVDITINGVKRTLQKYDETPDSMADNESGGVDITIGGTKRTVAKQADLKEIEKSQNELKSDIDDLRNEVKYFDKHLELGEIDGTSIKPSTIWAYTPSFFHSDKEPIYIKVKESYSFVVLKYNLDGSRCGYENGTNDEFEFIANDNEKYRLSVHKDDYSELDLNDNPIEYIKIKSQIKSVSEIRTGETGTYVSAVDRVESIEYQIDKGYKKIPLDYTKTNYGFESNAFSFDKASDVSIIVPTGYSCLVEKNMTTIVNWTSYPFSFFADENTNYKITVRKDNGTIKKIDLDGVLVYKNENEGFFDDIEFSLGDFNNDGSRVDTNLYISSSKLYSPKEDEVREIHINGNYALYAMIFDSEGNRIGTLDWRYNTRRIKFEMNKRYRFIICKTSEKLTPSNESLVKVPITILEKSFVDLKLVSNNERVKNVFSQVTYECTNEVACDGTDPNGFDYHTTMTQDIYDVYNALVRDFPNNVVRKWLGKDESGTLDVWAYEINFVTNAFAGTNKDHARKAYNTIVIETGVHGMDEGKGDNPTSVYAICYLIDDICRRWKDSKALEVIRRTCKLCIIPTSNPWGCDNRKKGNVTGTNVSDDYDWCWDTYEQLQPTASTAPFGQAESRHVRDYVLSLGKIDFFYDVHTTGGGNQTLTHDKAFWLMIERESIVETTISEELGQEMTYLLRKQGLIDDNIENCLYLTQDCYSPDAPCYFKYVHGINSILVEVSPNIVGQTRNNANIIKIAKQVIGNLLLKTIYYIN